MKPIFISYRLADGIERAKLIRQLLEKEFGEDSVFLDTSTLQVGDTWPDAIRGAVADAKVVIVMIGPNWAGKINEQKVRIFQEEDWVRKEIEAALQAQKKIFPILVENVLQPKQTELPESIHDLLKIQMISIRSLQFEVDLMQVITQMEKILKVKNADKNVKSITQNADKIYNIDHIDKADFS